MIRKDENGKLFYSVVQLARKYNVTEHVIRDRIAKDMLQTRVINGRHRIYTDAEKNMIEQFGKPELSKVHRNRGRSKYA